MSTCADCAAREHQDGTRAVDNSASADPPRDNLFRAIRPGYQLRDDTAGGMPTMVGHFAVFNQWTEINSFFEGRFLERFDPTSMDRTFATDRAAMRVLFQHGRDPQIGDKPLGPIDTLEARPKGAYYEVPMLDTQYNRELLPGLRADLYGASFRFQVIEENWNKKPGRSKSNPDGLPERTVLDAHVMEFGPVTFPAYAGATAGVRSVTDDFLGLALGGIDPERLAEFLNLTGRPGAWSAGGGDPDPQLGNGDGSTSDPLADPAVRDRLFRLAMEGLIK